MIEALTATSIAEPPRAPRQSEAADFSYALASIALESRAGAALQAFGSSGGASDITGAPSGKTKAERGTSLQQSGTPVPAKTTPDHTAIAATEEPAPPESHTPGGTTPPLTTAAPVSATPAPTAPALAVQILETAPATARVEATALRDAAAARAQAGARGKGAALVPPERQAQTENFAQLLARRLEHGATAFELRLDPPELGRVAARLALDAHGRAELALSFDNQSALDLFRRDEAGLRALLAAAGFSLGDGDLAFSFNAGGGERGAAPDASARGIDRIEGGRPHAPPVSDRAAISSGVIDLFI